MTFADHVIRFSHALRPDWPVPDDYRILFPYEEKETMDALKRFYRKYYDDEDSRIFLFGINPGRFGAGVTGVPFTDPIRLEEVCGIDNDFSKKAELSSIFVYECVAAYGGPSAFYRHFYITSLSPLGFTHNGKNFNYYDARDLEQAVEPFILENIRRQMAFGTSPRVAVCLGRGKNMAYFEKLNARHGFFDHILPLPHPRWVMQYRRKRMPGFVRLYLDTLAEARRLAGWGRDGD